MKSLIFATGLLISSFVYAMEIENPEEIKVFLGSFKTYNGKSLVNLLSSYDLNVQYISTTPMSDISPGSMKKGDNKEDLIISIMLNGNAKPMPCNLHIWMNQGIPKDYKYKQEHLAEITIKQGKFDTSYPELDPVLYWAATGKCSTEYYLPQ